MTSERVGDPSGGDAVIAEIRRLLERITPQRRLAMRRHHSAVDVCIHPDGAPVGDEGKLIAAFYDRGYGDGDAAFLVEAPRLLTVCLSRLEAQAQQILELTRQVALYENAQCIRCARHLDEVEAQAQALREWQPIETAPKDGTPVRLKWEYTTVEATGRWCPANKWPAPFATDDWRDVKGDDVLLMPTHWAALASSETSQEKP
jgi:hypothetical protein